jgi:hypothetical protein
MIKQKRSLRTTYKIFLFLIAVTATVWILRGFGLLTFIPGGLIWLLLLGTIGLGVFDGVQGTRR